MNIFKIIKNYITENKILVLILLFSFLASLAYSFYFRMCSSLEIRSVISSYKISYFIKGLCSCFFSFHEHLRRAYFKNIIFTYIVNNSLKTFKKGIFLLNSCPCSIAWIAHELAADLNKKSDKKLVTWVRIPAGALLFHKEAIVLGALLPMQGPSSTLNFAAFKLSRTTLAQEYVARIASFFIV